MSENQVTLNLSSYNQIKAENVRFQMFIGRLFESAELRDDYSGIEFDTKYIADLVHLCYPDMYKKKLATLRTQQTKMGLKKLENECLKKSEIVESEE